jgi:hypothetical protein
MALEEQLMALNKTVEQGLAALLAALKPGQSPTPVVDNTTAQATSGNGADKTQPAFDEVVAVAHELARVRGTPVAAKLIKQHGAERLAGLPKDSYAGFLAAATVLLQQQEAPASEL